MHKSLPKIFIFLKQLNPILFNYNNTNIGIIYRNYENKKNDNELNKIAKICKKKRYKLFIANDLKLAVKVKADGIYIPSFNKNIVNSIGLNNKKLLVIGSAHNQKEIKIKIAQQCNAIFLSPIFPITKSETYLGINKFNLLSNLNNINILALGGINENNYSKLKMLKIAGFGGISLFKKKTGLIKAGFFKE